MKNMSVKFCGEVNVIFGWNVSGLMAAEQWRKVWPNTQNKIHITSSIFKASLKVTLFNRDIFF